MEISDTIMRDLVQIMAMAEVTKRQGGESTEGSGVSIKS